MLKKLISGAVLGAFFFFPLQAFSQNGDPNYDDLDREVGKTTKELAELGGMETNGNIQESYLTKFMDSASKKFLSDFLAENPFSKVPKSQLKTLIQSRFEGTPVGSFLEKEPKRMAFFVDLVRDKEAIPSFIKIVNEPQKVKKYGIIVLCVFIATFLFNLLNSKGNLFKRIFKKLMIGLVAFSVNIGAFYFIFQDNLRPGLNIFFKYFHF